MIAEAYFGIADSVRLPQFYITGLDLCLWCAEGTIVGDKEVDGVLTLFWHEGSKALHFSNTANNARHAGKEVRAINRGIFANMGQGEERKV